MGALPTWPTQNMIGDIDMLDPKQKITEEDAAEVLQEDEYVYDSSGEYVEIDSSEYYFEDDES